MHWMATSFKLSGLHIRMSVCLFNQFFGNNFTHDDQLVNAFTNSREARIPILCLHSLIFQAHSIPLWLLHSCSGSSQRLLCFVYTYILFIFITTNKQKINTSNAWLVNMVNIHVFPWLLFYSLNFVYVFVFFWHFFSFRMCGVRQAIQKY